MAFGVIIHKDSISSAGPRLTTMEVSFPRNILAEFNTHRVFSRNSASSRAIPVGKMLNDVEQHPYVPIHWGKNQKGMQASEELSPEDQLKTGMIWHAVRDQVVTSVRALHRLDVHKQVANRLLEPFMWHKVIVTATEWDNFFHLRNHPAASPEMQTIAGMMQDAYEASEPALLAYDEWHRPLVSADEIQSWLDAGDSEFDQSRLDSFWSQVSIGRCARVSYLTHDGRRDLSEDLSLCHRLKESGHLSPFEHVARPAVIEDSATARGMLKDLQHFPVSGLAWTPACQWHGNLRGWVSFRSTIPNEHDILGASNG